MRVTRIMAVASVALVVVGSLALTQRTLQRPADVFLAADHARPASVPFTFAWTPPLNVPPLGTALKLPSWSSGARLTSIPDALLNDQPAARFRVPVEVRGRRGLVTVNGPTVLAWSEAGYWYELASTGLTVEELIDLASALE